MDRDSELRIKGHLYEIEEVNDEYIGHQQGFPVSRDAYERTLTSVADCVSESRTPSDKTDLYSCIDAVAEYVKDRIRSSQERPNNRKVRRKARRVVSEAGYAPDSYLNAA
jgi:ribosome-associated translation inhibitor RaiA